MYYKVLKDGKVIDALDRLTFVKYQEKHKIMLLCDESEAQGIVSSDGRHYWHLDYLYNFPVYGFDAVELEEIDAYEYEQLQVLNCKSVNEVIDWYTLELIKGGVL